MLPNGNKAQIDVNDYLKVSEAAHFLGVTTTTLRNWDRQGKLTAYRHPINGYRLYSRSELEALIITIKGSTTH
jgi:excisionase family DNA binding protein